MSTQDQQFHIGQRCQVVNVQPDGTPGQYHGCTCTVTMLFTHEGQRVAKVRLPGGNEKKIALDKLLPAPAVQPAPFQKPAPAPRSTYVPRLPSWARKGMAMYRGDELESGDLVYFSPKANPRQLQRQIGIGEWRGVTIATYRGVEKRYPGTIAINPFRWYVVERRAVQP